MEWVFLIVGSVIGGATAATLYSKRLSALAIEFANYRASHP